MVSVTFDPAKRRLNLAKHGIDLAECGAIFDWPMVTIVDSRGYAEDVISCRRADRNEQEDYFEIYPAL
jgi:hypothetical protein